jgi:hypothetical protein
MRQQALTWLHTMKKLLLLLLISLAAASHAQVPQIERDALVALYNSTDGANWTDNTGWNGSAGGECDWKGVACSAGDSPNVIRLLLSNNSLTGTIPAELGNLTNLTHLHLYTNSLTGTIPAELGNMTSLNYLWLQSNSLTGTIPAELGNLTSLTSLSFGNNSLSGSIPAWLGNLTNLTSLSLYNNSLSGSIPAGLGNLTNVTSLNLYGNSLTGSIPTKLGNMTSLKYLRLYNNLLTGTIPTELGNLKDLSTLVLDNNLLSRPAPASLDGFTIISSAFAFGEDVEKSEKAEKEIADEISKIDLTSLQGDPESEDLVNNIARKTTDLLAGISSNTDKDLYLNTQKKDAIDLGLSVLNLKAVNLNITDIPSTDTVTLPTKRELSNIDSTITLISNIANVLVELPANDSSVKELGDSLVDNAINTIFPLVSSADGSSDDAIAKKSDEAIEKFLDIQESITAAVSENTGELYIPIIFQEPNEAVSAITSNKEIKIINIEKRRIAPSRLAKLKIPKRNITSTDSLRTISALAADENVTVETSTQARFNSIAGFTGVDHNDVQSDFYFGNAFFPANIVSINYSVDSVAQSFVFNEDGSLKVKLDDNITATLYPAFYNTFELVQAIRNDFANYAVISAKNVVRIMEGDDSFYAKSTFSPFKLSDSSSSAKTAPQFSINDGVYTITYSDSTEEKLVPHFTPKLFDYLVAQDHGYKYNRKSGAITIDGHSYMPEYLVTPIKNIFSDRIYLSKFEDQRFNVALEYTHINQDDVLDLYVYTKDGKQAFIAQ